VSLKSHNLELDPNFLHCRKDVSELHEPAVKQYEKDIKNGKKIPAIVVQEIRGIMVVVGGNHRVEAHVRQKKKIKAEQLATLVFACGEPWVDPFKE
jgi:hypothetical protein